MSNDDKVRENRLRRAAARQGLALSRSRRRDPRALDFGRYWLSRDGVMESDPAGISLDEVETFLLGTPTAGVPT
ncbi:hypothetical protein [Micromonospora sp. DT227]|uniref:hypothetical protein n=1 Tax=Micromonospora sp. DT227 TaxID=3393433 RepID=UPI003CF53040